MSNEEGHVSGDSEEEQPEEGSEPAGSYEVCIVRDSLAPLNCAICGQLLHQNNDSGLVTCNACGPIDAVSVSSSVRPEYYYDIDHTGMIWMGLPDDPEPYCHVKSLPIWSMHPNDPAFRHFPLSKFQEQLDLASAYSPDMQTFSYECFVCSGTHTFVPRAPAW